VRDLNRSFWLLFTGQLTSAIGTASTAVALPLVVLRLTGDLVQAGVVAFVVAAATLAGKLPGGVLADRLDRRTLMITCDLIRLLAMVILTSTLLAGVTSLPVLILVGVLEGLLGSTFAAASSGAVRRLVDEASWPRALSLMQVISAVSLVAGPLIGGALLLWNTAAPFAFDAATYLISAVCLAAIRRRLRVQTPTEGLFRSAVTGLRFVARAPFLLYAAINATVLNLIFDGLVLMLIATSAEPGQDSLVTGVQVAALGIGLLLGSIAAPAMAKRLRPDRGIALSTAAIAPPMAAFALFPTGWPSLVLLMLTAATAPLVNVVIGTNQLRMTPDELQGRVHSAVTLLAMTAAPLGPILAGIAVQAIGIGHTVMIAAGIVVVLAAAGWWITAGNLTSTSGIDHTGTNKEAVGP
jgi:MFS family permease